MQGALIPPIAPIAASAPMTFQTRVLSAKDGSLGPHEPANPFRTNHIYHSPRMLRFAPKRAKLPRIFPEILPVIKPRSDLVPNTADYENLPLVTANGFREYDARWLFGKEINLLGIQALGLGLGTYLHDIGVAPKVVTGHDFRSYSLSIKQALTIGLLRVGLRGA